MKFGITWGAANSGPMTLKVGAAPAAPVLSADGSVATPGLAVSGGRALLEYVGGAFRMLSGGAGAGGAARYYWQFTASGTWTKPAGLPDGAMVTVEMWGGGGGGGSHSSGGGGGGGGYTTAGIRVADLPSTVPVTIGAGGAINGNGGDTLFGTLLRARGGGTGAAAAGGAGGAGGAVDYGVPAAEGGAASTAAGRAGSGGGEFGGGGGGGGTSATGSSYRAGAGGGGVFGGGGGGGGGMPAGTPGPGLGGLSARAGNGGDSGLPGETPAGGGGRGAPGARGEVRIWI